MNLIELFEAATSELYHSTRLDRAANILENKYFKLTASAGTSSELQFHKPGKFYYLSTSRSKVGDYTLHNYYLDGVVFNLNGDWLNQHYTTSPVDYWERSWAQSSGRRTSEAEDRIYSKQPTIPLPTPATKLISSIHVLFEVDKIKPKEDDNRFLWLRKTLIGAKKLGIPIYIYKTPNDWITQNPRKRIGTGELVKTMTTYPPKPSWGRTKRDYFKTWRELYFKNNKEDLSKDAKQALYKIDVYSRDAIIGLEADIHNSRTQGDPGLIKLLKIWQKLGINTAREYITYLNKKWTAIENEK